MFFRSVKAQIYKHSQCMLSRGGLSMRNQLLHQNNFINNRIAQMSFNNKNSVLNKPAGMNASPAYLD